MCNEVKNIQILFSIDNATCGMAMIKLFHRTFKCYLPFISPILLTSLRYLVSLGKVTIFLSPRLYSCHRDNSVVVLSRRVVSSE